MSGQFSVFRKILTRKFNLLLLIMYLPACVLGQTEGVGMEWILAGRSAVTLSDLALYADSNYLEQTRMYLKESTILKVLDRSQGYYMDASEKQKFRWFQVKSQEGFIGWVHGDKLALIQSSWKVPPSAKPHHKARLDLGPPYRNSLSWVAALEGLDVLYKNDFLNPRYREEYLVITNEQGNCLLLPLGREAQDGASFTHQLIFRDFTGDQDLEIVLHQGNYALGSDLDERHFEMHQLREGQLEKIIDENLSLQMPDGSPAPTFYKVIEYGPGLIRTGFVDFISCKKYSLPYDPDILHFTGEWCMEYVTYSYVWEEEKGRFEKWYGENRSALQARVLAEGTLLKEMPSEEVPTVAILPQGAGLVVIKQISGPFESITPWLLVRASSGTFGYLKADRVMFVDVEHASILNRHYRGNPVSDEGMEWVRWMAD